MAIKIRKINDLERVELLLRGGILGGKSLKDGPIYNLDAKTLIFTQPEAKTITFATTPHSTQEPLTLSQIITQINAGLTDPLASAIQGQLTFVEAIPDDGVTIDKAGTANKLLGLDSDDDMVGVIYNGPGGGTPQLISLSIVANCDGMYIVVTDE